MSLEGRFCKYKEKVYEVFRSPFGGAYGIRLGIEGFSISEEDLLSGLLPNCTTLNGVKCKGFKFKRFSSFIYLEHMVKYEGVEGVLECYYNKSDRMTIVFKDGSRFSYPSIDIYKQLFEKKENINRID